MDQATEDYIESRYNHYEKSIIYYLTEWDGQLIDMIVPWYVNKTDVQTIAAPGLPLHTANMLIQLNKFYYQPDHKLKYWCGMLATVILYRYVFSDDFADMDYLDLEKPLLHWNIYALPDESWFRKGSYIYNYISSLPERVEIVKILNKVAEEAQE